MTTPSDETRAYVRRLADLVLELERWVERGGSRYFLEAWLEDADYALRRLAAEDEIDRLEGKQP